MRCVFCDAPVLEKSERLGPPVTLSGVGVAHERCAQRDLVESRVFGSLRLKDLPTPSLYELRELLLNELNHREGCGSEIELF